MDHQYQPGKHHEIWYHGKWPFVEFFPYVALSGNRKHKKSKSQKAKILVSESRPTGTWEVVDGRTTCDWPGCAGRAYMVFYSKDVWYVGDEVIRDDSSILLDINFHDIVKRSHVENPMNDAASSMLRKLGRPSWSSLCFSRYWGRSWGQ